MRSYSSRTVHLISNPSAPPPREGCSSWRKMNSCMCRWQTWVGSTMIGMPPSLDYTNFSKWNFLFWNRKRLQLRGNEENRNRPWAILHMNGLFPLLEYFKSIATELLKQHYGRWPSRWKNWEPLTFIGFGNCPVYFILFCGSLKFATSTAKTGQEGHCCEEWIHTRKPCFQMTLTDIVDSFV